jgi:hypothetical protein
MAKNKTVETEIDIDQFLNSLADNDQRKQDCLLIIELMSSYTGCKPKMWGASLIGFGSYHYTYPSGHTGDWFLIGFSPRKSAISLYVYSQTDQNAVLLEQLGKYTAGKGCIYIKKVSDIDINILENICSNTIAFLKESYT